MRTAGRTQLCCLSSLMYHRIYNPKKMERDFTGTALFAKKGLCLFWYRPVLSQ